MPQQNIENDDKIGHRTKSKEYSWVNSTRDLKLYLTIDGMLAAMKIIVIMSMLEPQLSSLRLCRLIFKAAGSRFTVLLQRCFCFFFFVFCACMCVCVCRCCGCCSSFFSFSVLVPYGFAPLYFYILRNACEHVFACVVVVVDVFWLWMKSTYKQTNTHNGRKLLRLIHSQLAGSDEHILYTSILYMHTQHMISVSNWTFLHWHQ